jgi:hypothetical protein
MEPQIVLSENEDFEEELNQEVDTMIECARFLKDLNKKNKSSKFEHILQDEIDVPILQKKRKHIDISDKNEPDNIFETDWRSKY